MRPPEIAIRVGRLARRDDDIRTPVRVDRHDFHRIEIVRGEAELATQESKRAAGDVSADPNRRIFTEWNDDAPGLGKRAERFADRRSGFDRDGTHRVVVIHALHRRDVDDDAHVGIGDEPFETMPAARDDESASFAHGIGYGGDDGFRRPDEANVVRIGDESLVESLLNDATISGIVAADFL